MLWRGGVDVTIRGKSRNHIDMEIDAGMGRRWRFTGVYGESRAELKHETWALLMKLFVEHEENPLPWLCAGDFNEILFHHEKEGVSKDLRLVWMGLEMPWKLAICMI